MRETMLGIDPPIDNCGRKDFHEYITTVITKNDKIIEGLLANPTLINPEILEDETVELKSERPYNLFIKSNKKPYVLANNPYMVGASKHSMSPVYIITTDCSHVISSVTMQNVKSQNEK